MGFISSGSGFGLGLGLLGFGGVWLLIVGPKAVHCTVLLYCNMVWDVRTSRVYSPSCDRYMGIRIDDISRSRDLDYILQTKNYTTSYVVHNITWCSRLTSTLLLTKGCVCSKKERK